VLDHISNWFSAKSPEDAYCSFISAHCALQKGQDLPELKQNQSLGKHLDESAKGKEIITDHSFEIVTNCYPDIPKTPSSYSGIGMTMKYKGMYESAIRQLIKGLNEITITKSEHFRLLSSKAHSLLEQGRNKGDEQKKGVWLKQSLVVSDQAQTAYHDMKEAGEINENLEGIVCWTLRSAACAAALLGRSEQAVAKAREAIETNVHVIDDDVRRKDLESGRVSNTDNTQDPTNTRKRLSDDSDRDGILQVDNNGSAGIESIGDLVNSTTVVARS
jgi:hypothetical protein